MRIHCFHCEPLCCGLNREILSQYKKQISHDSEREKYMEELRSIIERFADSGWELISVPSKAWLEGGCDKETLVLTIKQADKECGNCGCEFDPLYKKALALLYELC